MHLKGAGGQEGDGAVLAQLPDMRVGHLLSRKQGHRGLLSQDIVARSGVTAPGGRSPDRVSGWRAARARAAEHPDQGETGGEAAHVGPEGDTLGNAGGGSEGGNAAEELGKKA